MLKKFNPFEIADFCTDKINLMSIIKLRNGPLKISTFKKLMTGIFPNQTINFEDLLKNLKEKGFIEIVKASQSNNEEINESNQYLLLIKDIISLRKPSSSVQNKLTELIIPNDALIKYNNALKSFFKKYAKKGIAGDDPDVIQLFKDHSAIAAINYLRDHIIPLKSPPVELLYLDSTHSTQEQFLELLQKLIDQNFVFLCENPDNLEGPWVILLTDVDLHELFPEYIINGVIQQLNNKSLDKSTAILCLNILKNKYLEWNPSVELSRFPEEEDL